LPVPAPASISTGPSVVITASRCGGLRPARYAGGADPPGEGSPPLAGSGVRAGDSGIEAR
jgi:hypothetical protein